jgi:hypothetical protein
MKKNWDYIILDAMPSADNLAGLVCGDVDGDGKNEIIVSGEGKGALIWYRPSTYEKGIIKKNASFAPALELEDIDGDGRLELLAGEYSERARSMTDGYDDCMLVWFKYDAVKKNWSRKIIDPSIKGYAHDALFIDIDGDSQRELLANSCYSKTPAVYIYKKKDNLDEEWSKYKISEGLALEGLAAADINNDGRVEVIHGPELLFQGRGGPYGKWSRFTYATDIREMCRSSIIDINNNGFKDIILLESEFVDGRLCWFENQLPKGKDSWVEHLIDTELYFAHTLLSWKDPENNGIHLLVGEMTHGGWDTPINYNSRLIEYVTRDGGSSWEKNVIYEGEGTREAVFCDIDSDNKLEIVGEDWGKYYYNPKVQIWKQEERSMIKEYKHEFVERDKPDLGIEILSADLNDDNMEDIICGRWWYKNPNWKRFAIPGILQVVCAYDIDNDGKTELIALKGEKLQDGKSNQSQLCWIKPLDPENDQWAEYPIGTGSGDWPSGAIVASFEPGKLSLVVCYNGAKDGHSYFPEIFEIPAEPWKTPWEKKVFSRLLFGEKPVAADINGNGRQDILLGDHWLENLGNGNFKSHKIAEGFKAGRSCLMDVNNDGKLDIIIGENVIDYEKKITPYSRLAWFENPGKDSESEWKMNVISTLRCPHSISIADLDHDGENEIICGEHDPFAPYRNKCRLIVYKKAEPNGTAWKSFTLDNRFEHYNGAKPIKLSNGKTGIVSHGRTESMYLHLWI